jgi:hypothetical protein
MQCYLVYIFIIEIQLCDKVHSFTNSTLLRFVFTTSISHHQPHRKFPRGAPRADKSIKVPLPSGHLSTFHHLSSHSSTPSNHPTFTTRLNRQSALRKLRLDISDFAPYFQLLYSQFLEVLPRQT